MQELLDQLKKMSALQLRELALYYGIPLDYLSAYLPENPEPVRVALILLQYAQNNEGEDTPHLRELVKKMKPENQALIKISIAEYAKQAQELNIDPQMLNITQQTFQDFFLTLEKEQIPLEQAPDKIKEMAESYHYLNVLSRPITSVPTLDEDRDIQALRNQAKKYIEQHEWYEAEKILEEAFNKQKKIIEAKTANGEINPVLEDRCNDAADTREQMGQLRLTRLNYSKAGQYFTEAADISLSEKRGKLRYSAGKAFFQAAFYNQAKLQLQRALVIQEALWGESDLALLETHNALAETLRALGEFTQAETIYLELEESLPLAVMLAEDEKVGQCCLAAIKNDQGHLCHEQNQLKKAKFLYQEALDIREQYSDQPEKRAESLNNLATLLHSQGRQLMVMGEKQDALTVYEEACPFYEKALVLKQKNLHELHPSTLLTQHNLASLYRDQKNYSAALREFRAALNAKKKVLPKHHPSLATTYDGLGQLFYKQKQYTSARKMFQEAFSIRQKFPNKQHRSVGESLGNLARVEYDAGQYTQAAEYAEKALQIFKQAKLDNEAQICGKLLADIYAQVDESK